MKKAIQVFLLGVLVLVLTVTALAKHEVESRVVRVMNVVSKAKEFKKQHGRLPNSAGEIGIEGTTQDKEYYKKVDDDTFVVYMSFDFDETYTYHSDTETWTPDLPL